MSGESIDPRLVGTWKTDPKDMEALRAFGRVSMEFTVDGRLTYTIHAGRSEQKIFMTYRARGGVLITDQPSASRREETPYFITEDGRLVLSYGGRISRYFRKA